MKIEIEGSMCEGSVELSGDATIADAMDVITGALIMEGYQLDSIRDEYHRRAKLLGYKE